MTTTIEDRASSRGTIGFVIGSLVRGGAEIHLSQVLPELAARGYDVSVFVTGPHGPVAQDLANSGIRVIPARPLQIGANWWLWPRRLVRYSIMTWTYLRYAYRHRGGILHFFLPQAMIFGGVLTIAWHPRLIASQRGMFTHRLKQSYLMTRLEQFVLRRMSINLANSYGVAEAMLKEGLAADKIHVIYSGLSAQRMDAPGVDRRELRAQFDIGEDTFVIVTLANLFPYKGHGDLIAALGSLHIDGALGRDWLLMCIGRDIGADGNELEYSTAGSYQRVLEAQAGRAGIKAHVRFLGDQANAPALLRMMDIAVQPSHEEGFSNAVIEALAAGLPVIATRVAGNAEALAVGRLGVLVPPRDPIALAEAIANLYRSPERRRELGSKAQAHARATYTLQKCVDEYDAVYRALFAEHDGADRPGSIGANARR